MSLNNVVTIEMMDAARAVDEVAIPKSVDLA